MNLGFDRVEGVEDRLGLIEVLPSGIVVAQTQLNLCDGGKGVDVGILRGRLVDFASELV